MCAGRDHVIPSRGYGPAFNNMLHTDLRNAILGTIKSKKKLREYSLYEQTAVVEEEEGLLVAVLVDIPFLSIPEANLLNRLCRLATHYTRFDSFIRQYDHNPSFGKAGTSSAIDSSNVEKNSLTDGLYLRAVCQGLEVVLDPYRDALLRLEQDLLSDPSLTATHIQCNLEQYQMLFPALSAVLDQIVQQKAQGCYILDILHKASVSGIPIVSSAFQSLLHVCHCVMYKQLAAWMLHGLLLDHHGEFYIQRVIQPPEQSLRSQHGSSLGDEDELGLGGVTGKQIEQILKVSTHDSVSGERFAIHAGMLPSYIPLGVADKILFIGESVHMFLPQKSSHAKHRHKDSIMRDQTDPFAKKLHALSESDMFHLMDFEAAIDEISAFVAKQLWQLVVEEGNLLGHMHTMKDFFLLGRGELYLAFIDIAHNLLRKQPTSTMEHDVQRAFLQAARNVLFEDEAILQQFKLSVGAPDQDKRSGSASGVADTGWTLLSLSYSVHMPLHILFSPSVLERYNMLFKFLLYVKRVQVALQHCWMLQQQQKDGATKWWLRNHMAFLIDNLQYYLQVDVIESQYSILLEQIQKTHDFEVLRLAHDTFLTSLLSQSFLLTKPIAHCLSAILELCQNFCSLITQAEDMLTPQEQTHLDEITKNFQLQSGLLFKILSSVRSHQASPHLSQLLLRINFNHYFSRAGGQLGSSSDSDSDTLKSFSDTEEEGEEVFYDAKQYQ